VSPRRIAVRRTILTLALAVGGLLFATGKADAQVIVGRYFDPWAGYPNYSVTYANPYPYYGGIGAASVYSNPYTGSMYYSNTYTMPYTGYYGTYNYRYNPWTNTYRYRVWNGYRGW
jgi:hypothetical protein